MPPCVFSHVFASMGLGTRTSERIAKPLSNLARFMQDVDFFQELFIQDQNVLQIAIISGIIKINLVHSAPVIFLPQEHSNFQTTK